MRMRFLLGRIPLIQSPKHKCDPRAVEPAVPRRGGSLPFGALSMALHLAYLCRTAFHPAKRRFSVVCGIREDILTGKLEKYNE